MIAWRPSDRCTVLREGSQIHQLGSCSYEFLRIAVTHRKPRGLDLHDDPVSLHEYVVMVAEREVRFGRLVRRERMQFLVGCEIPAAADPSLRQQRFQATSSAPAECW